MIQINKILKQVPIFRTLGKDSIDYIVERLKFKTFSKSETICKIGDPGDIMYIIINGAVDIVIYDADGKDQVVATLKSGDYFGEMSLLTGEPRSASVISTDNCEMFLLHKNDFDVILERFPSISLSMGKIVSKRLRETLSKAITMPSQKEIAAGATKGPSGDLKEQPFIELIAFCDTNSLTGTLKIEKADVTGLIEYQKGEMTSIKVGDLKDDKALDEMMNWTEGKFSITVKPLTLEAQKAAKKEIESETRKILIVNNSLVVRKLIERAFKGLGYIVSTAPSIKDSEALIAKDVPDIIISDIKLTDGDGLEFCTKVRKNNDCSFIFLSDDSINPDVEAKLAEMENTELTKTHEVSEIVKIVENMI